MFPITSRILIADDMPSLRELLKAHLRRMGFKVIVEANDGQEAYQLMVSAKAAGSHFDLVISDWNMPGMNGVDLLKVVRAVEAWKNLPFIMLTTESEKSRVMEAILAGASNYIVKPIEANTLEEKLKAVWAKMQQGA